jgi:ribonuclease HI
VKVSIDAGYYLDTGSASTGIVICDHEGKVLLSAWRWLRSCGSPEEAEAEACLQGIRLASKWIRQSTEVESDFQLLVRRLRSNEQDRVAWSGLVEETRAVCNLLPQYQVMHVRREANGVAHELAKRAIQKKECVVMRFRLRLDIQGLGMDPRRWHAARSVARNLSALSLAYFI